MAIQGTPATPAVGPLTIGLVYDLRDDYLQLGWDEHDVAEFDSVTTVEGLEHALATLGHASERIGNADALVQRLAAGERWPVVFSVAEGIAGRGRESLVPALLDHYGIAAPFADALVCGLTLDKPLAKRVLRDLGIPTPAFTVVDDEATARTLTFPLPAFAKPAREGSSKGIHDRCLARSEADLRSVCRELVARYQQPVLVEAYLPGREVTVSVLGEGEAAEVLGVLEVRARGKTQAPEVYSWEAKENWRDMLDYALVQGADADPASPASAAALALRAYRGLGCRDAGRVDLRQDDRGAWSVLEINALPGMNHITSDLPITARLAGWSYPALIERILGGALRRVTATQAAARRDGRRR